TGLDPLLRRVARRIEFLHQIKVEQESRTSATIDPSALIYPSAQVNNLSGDPTAIVVGAHSVLRGDLMTFWSGGSIKLGEWCYVGQDARIWSEASIEIGNHVLISHLVDIQDSNSHPIDWRERSRDGEAVLSGDFDRRPTIEVAPIVIED